MTNENYIYRKIKSVALASRKLHWLEQSPRLLTEEHYNSSSRLKIILTNHVCSQPTCTMCPLPNYRSVLQSSARSQLNLFFKIAEHRKPAELVIYNDGSFFGPEIAEDIRDYVATRISQLDVAKLSIESSPQFLIDDRLRNFAKKVRKGIEIEISIGLQTYSDSYRNILLGSNFDLHKYEIAVEQVLKNGFHDRTHVLTPLPLLTMEESLNELIKTLIYLSNHDDCFISICLLRPQPDTLVGRWHKDFLVLPPWPGLISTGLSILKKKNVRNKKRHFKFDGLDNFTCGQQSFPWLLCNNCWEHCLKLIRLTTNIASAICEDCARKIEFIDSKIQELEDSLPIRTLHACEL